eukprot:2581558-Pyramimonas_sp.AAC.1
MTAWMTSEGVALVIVVAHAPEVAAAVGQLRGGGGVPSYLPQDETDRADQPSALLPAEHWWGVGKELVYNEPGVVHRPRACSLAYSIRRTTCSILHVL